jgi:hypothetical protein
MLFTAGGLPSAFASAPTPAWVQASPFIPYQDGAYRYYRGFSLGSVNTEVALKEATSRALLSLIEDTIGPVTTHDSILAALKATKAARAKDPDDFDDSRDSGDVLPNPPELVDLLRYIKIFDFSQWEIYRAEIPQKNADEDAPKHFDLWVLFRYKIEERTKEMTRLFHLKPEFDGAFRSPLKTGELDAFGGLRIESNPPLSQITIDGHHYGATPEDVPVTLDFQPGGKTVKLENRYFEPFAESVVLEPDQRARVRKELIQRTGTVKVDSHPEGASVVLGGKSIGITPTGEVRATVGRKILLEISQAESDRWTGEIDVQPDELSELDVKLSPKPTYLSVNSDPTAVQIELDGEPMGPGTTPTGMIRVDPGAHEVRLSGDGIVDYLEEIQVPSGSRLELPVIKLRKVDHAVVRESQGDYHLQNQPYLFSLGVSYDGNTYSNAVISSYLTIQIALTHRFYKKLSYKVGFSFDGIHSSTDAPVAGNTNAVSADTLSLRGYSVFASLPIKILPWNSFHENGHSLSLDPEIGIVRHHLITQNQGITEVDATGAVADQFIPQYYEALGLEYRFLPVDLNNSFGVTAWVGFRNFNTYQTYIGAFDSSFRIAGLMRF